MYKNMVIKDIHWLLVVWLLTSLLKKPAQSSTKNSTKTEHMLVLLVTRHQQDQYMLCWSKGDIAHVLGCTDDDSSSSFTYCVTGLCCFFFSRDCGSDVKQHLCVSQPSRCTVWTEMQFKTLNLFKSLKYEKYFLVLFHFEKKTLQHEIPTVWMAKFAHANIK